MSEIYKIILTSSLTILGGVIVFVSGQIVVKFFIEPIYNLRKLIGEIAFSLDFYANQIYGDHPKTTEAREVYRKQACQLRESCYLILYYDFISLRISSFPPKENLEKASSLLIGLSNKCGTQPAGIEHSPEIKELLRIKSV